MTDETRLAFAHPSERSAATAVRDPLDRISVRDLTVEVEIGAFQVERDTTQRLRFNVVVEVRPVEAPLDDDVEIDLRKRIENDVDLILCNSNSSIFQVKLDGRKRVLALYNINR